MVFAYVIYYWACALVAFEFLSCLRFCANLIPVLSEVLCLMYDILSCSLVPFRLLSCLRFGSIQ